MNDTTPRGTATITEKTAVRTNLGTVILVIASLLGGTVWATLLYADIQQLKKDMILIKETLHIPIARNP